MTPYQTIESLCSVIQTQALLIRKLSAALEQFEAAEPFQQEVTATEAAYKDIIGESTYGGENCVH